MIETLLGGLLGGTFRLAPEALKLLDRKGERCHELTLQDKALEFEKLRGAQKMAETNAGAEAAWTTGALASLKEAVAAQGRPSGVRWVDALNATVQPGDVLRCQGGHVRRLGAGEGGLWHCVVCHLTDTDRVLLPRILNYWFLNRTLEEGPR